MSKHPDNPRTSFDIESRSSIASEHAAWAPVCRRESSPDDLSTWEGEGGALSKPTAMIFRHALPGRASEEPVVAARLQEVTFSASRHPPLPFLVQAVADENEKRSKAPRSWSNGPSHPSDKRRGRRTMGRHGNRP